MKEIWKDIKKYENIYQVSNLGRIKSKDRIIYDKNSQRNRMFKGKILKQIKRKDGYLFVNLSKNNKSEVKKVHKIVAENFIQNPNEYSIINHIDGNKENNCANNLEWCTCSHNLKEAYKLKLKKPIKLYGKDNPTSKKVYQYSLDGNFIKEWECIKEASKLLKIKDSNISLCCKGKRNKAGEFIWKYKEFNK